MAQGAKGRSRQADPSGPSTNQTRSGHVKGTGGRLGLFGSLRSAEEAWRERPAAIEPPRRDPSSYDLIIIGTPVWAWSTSSPVRAYLTAMKARLPDVAFFCTLGASGRARVFGPRRQGATRCLRYDAEGRRFRHLSRPGRGVCPGARVCACRRRSNAIAHGRGCVRRRPQRGSLSEDCDGMRSFSFSTAVRRAAMQIAAAFGGAGLVALDERLRVSRMNSRAIVR